jgi:hypothetical protein
MEQVQVKILCQVVTAAHGTLNTGAMLRTDAAFAKHLVEDCKAAEYVKAPAAAPKNPAETSKPKAATAPKKNGKSSTPQDPASPPAGNGGAPAGAAPVDGPAGAEGDAPAAQGALADDATK